MIIEVAALLPIAPLLLLPFILVFFIVVFPFWLVGVAIFWTLRLLVRLIGGGPDGRWAARAQIWFRWVLTFGGFAESYANTLSPKAPAVPTDPSVAPIDRSPPSSGRTIP